jgi:hypothetical protein
MKIQIYVAPASVLELLLEAMIQEANEAERQKRARSAENLVTELGYEYVEGNWVKPKIRVKRIQEPTLRAAQVISQCYRTKSAVQEIPFDRDFKPNGVPQLFIADNTNQDRIALAVQAAADEGVKCLHVVTVPANWLNPESQNDPS